MKRLVPAAACALALAAAGCDESASAPGQQATPEASATAGAAPTAGPAPSGMALPGDSGAVQASGHEWPSCGEAWDDEDGGVSPYDDSCAIDERFGVFADPVRGDDARSDGSRDRPYRTLQRALAAAVHAGKRVYACAGVYEEPLLIGTELSDGLALYGGLSCETFLVDPAGARSVVRAQGGGAALTIAQTRAISIERFDFESVPGERAAGTTYVGAMIQDTERIVLRDVSLRAAAGEPGADGSPPDAPAGDGSAGPDGSDACTRNPNPGGAVVGNNACPVPNIAGGSGGEGGVGTAFGGGGMQFGFQSTLGDNGAGWSCVAGSGMGYAPYAGGAGQIGRGARGFGALVGTGFVGFAGQAGGDGGVGFGGAGGGGARAPASCSGLGTAVGASAGAGGSGGCGGQGGDGGRAGGSSIGLIVVNSRVQLEHASIVYGDGGAGGDGAPGQAGGSGGTGGSGGRGAGGSNAACDGIDGGDGGDGGPGGGGNGGHALGVLYVGSAPALVETAGEAEAQARAGGAPGTGPAGLDPTLETQLTGTPGLASFTYAF